MDTLILSRLQFALTAAIHFIMPATTLGLAFFLVVSEAAFLKTGLDAWRRVSNLGVRILAFVFAVGVATGIIIPFAFGSNWANFVSFASSVFGIHLTIEAIVAFLLESTFLGVLLFGRNRVSKGMYFFSALMVFVGSHLSAFFIVSANSWLQTPFHSLQTLASGIPLAEVDGFHIATLADGSTKLVMDDVWKILFSPSTMIRYTHVIVACWLTGAVVMGAVAAAYLRKKADSAPAKKALFAAVTIGVVTALLQPVIGHEHIMKTLEWQPVKNAAMEGIFKNQNGAPLYAIGIVDETNRTTYGLGLPYGLSFFETFNFNSEVHGVDDLVAYGKANPNANPAGNWKSEAPPIQVVFQSFHLMVMAGMLLIAGLAIAAWQLIRKKAFKPWMLVMLIALAPLPYIAVETGWFATEFGRQPWLIFGILTTADAVSAVPVGYVVFGLALLIAVWIVLIILSIRWMPRIIREGLEHEFAPLDQAPAAAALDAKEGK